MNSTSLFTFYYRSLFFFAKPFHYNIYSNSTINILCFLTSKCQNNLLVIVIANPVSIIFVDMKSLYIFHQTKNRKKSIIVLVIHTFIYLAFSFRNNFVENFIKDKNMHQALSALHINIYVSGFLAGVAPTSTHWLCQIAQFIQSTLYIK